jgi:hypothetical protein
VVPRDSRERNVEIKAGRQVLSVEVLLSMICKTNIWV